MVEGTYFTDPFCPFCWAAEGALRRLEHEFAGNVRISFVLAGRFREVDGAELAAATLKSMADSAMPADPRVWLEDPPRSSHPASIATLAVAEQADPGPFLRRVREAVLLERRRMDSAPALMEAARETGGLDLERLRVDLGSHAMLERLGDHLERGRSHELPSVRFGEDQWVRGSTRWQDWRAAAVAAGAEPVASPPSVEDALRRFGRMATVEVAAVCNLPGPRAAAELWRLALEFRVRPERVLGGEVWASAS